MAFDYNQLHVGAEENIRRTHLLEPHVIGIVYLALCIAVSIQCNDVRLVFLCHVLKGKIEINGKRNAKLQRLICLPYAYAYQLTN